MSGPSSALGNGVRLQEGIKVRELKTPPARGKPYLGYVHVVVKVFSLPIPGVAVAGNRVVETTDMSTSLR